MNFFLGWTLGTGRRRKSGRVEMPECCLCFANEKPASRKNMRKRSQWNLKRREVEWNLIVFRLEWMFSCLHRNCVETFAASCDVHLEGFYVFLAHPLTLNFFPFMKNDFSRHSSSVWMAFPLKMFSWRFSFVSFLVILVSWSLSWFDGGFSFTCKGSFSDHLTKISLWCYFVSLRLF